MYFRSFSGSKSRANRGLHFIEKSSFYSFNRPHLFAPRFYCENELHLKCDDKVHQLKFNNNKCP